MDSDNTQAGCFSGFFARKTRKRTAATLQSTVSASSQAVNERRSVSEKNLGVSDTAEKKRVNYDLFHDFSYGNQDKWWTLGSEQLPSYSLRPDVSTPSDDISSIIENSLDENSKILRDLSLQIHDHPELMFKERFAHDLLTDFMAKQGFEVTQHYLGLDTAWRAEYSQGEGGRVIGVNSEMDALVGLGHACGHNLIAIAGVGVAIALKAALQARGSIAGKIVLLGTPAEEGGGGKIILLEKGAYEEMDVCVMCHPSAGPLHSAGLGSTTSMQAISVEYVGHSAHAGVAPWEGTNALDAAFSAYSSISMLRQQMKPDQRVHGIVEGQNWVPNVIPDNATMHWIARAPTAADADVLSTRVVNCLNAAALATGCKAEVKLEHAYFDLHQNPVLAQGFTDIVGSRYGLLTNQDANSASTDFGNVSYVLPSLHPTYAIPTVPNGGNHTPAFTEASRSEEAHEATIVVTKALALTSYRVLTDTEFFTKVKASFEQQSARSQRI